MVRLVPPIGIAEPRAVDGKTTFPPPLVETACNADWRPDAFSAYTVPSTVTTLLIDAADKLKGTLRMVGVPTLSTPTHVPAAEAVAKAVALALLNCVQFPGAACPQAEAIQSEIATRENRGFRSVIVDTSVMV
jgi:hypothetical protein